MEDEYNEELQYALQLSLQESMANSPQAPTPTPTPAGEVSLPFSSPAPAPAPAPSPSPSPSPSTSTPTSTSPAVQLPSNLFSFTASPPSWMEKWGEGAGEEYKMVLVVRSDLGMKKGKMCAQCGHATLGAYKQAIGTANLRKWEEGGEAKIALKVDSEQQLLELARKCELSGLNHYVVADAGRTQIKSGSLTVLSIGPAPKSKIDVITGSLKLL